MNSLSHLPEDKQNELAEIVKIIREVADPVKIILFGSHTGNDWVDDEYVENGVTYSYKSDYDILIVIDKGDKEKEHEIASKIENRTLKYNNEVSPIVHTIDYVNNGLECGQYFFRDIIKEGIVLFDSGKYFFSECKYLTKQQEKEIAIRGFENWIKVGSRFLDGTKVLFANALKQGADFRQVVFNLNQTAEKFYGGILLIYTGYKPKTHRLKVYRKYSKHISEDLNRIFKYPLDNSEEYRLFDILNKSYLDARYQDNYQIDIADLKILIEKVEKLEKVAERLSIDKIESL